MKVVHMVQVMPHRWDITSASGFVLCKGIVACDLYEATDFVRRYVSSFSDWSYILIPLVQK